MGTSCPKNVRTLSCRPSGQFPKGPKIEKIQDRPLGLKFSIEIENFNPDPQQTPIFLWGILKVRIEIFNPDRKFQARLKFSIESDFFNLWALRVLDIFWTISRHFSDILSTFPFSGLSKGLPITTLILHKVLGSDFGRTDFSRILFLGRRIFSRILSPHFFSSALREKVPRKIHQENPLQILQKLYNKKP